MTASTARALLAAGSVYLARFSGGVAQAPQGPFEASKFAITPKSTVKNAVSKGRDTYGQVVETVVVPDVPEFAIDLTEVNKVTLAIALLGDGAIDTQASGTLAAVAYTLDVLDSWVDLGKGNISDVVVTNTGATVTYVEGTDFIVNPNLGWIKPLSTGTMTAAEPVKVSATYTSFSETTISGMTDAQLRVRATFDGQNLVDGSPVIATVYEVVLGAKDTIDFLLSDFNKVSLSGSMKTPAGFLAPFIVKLRDPS